MKINERLLTDYEKDMNQTESSPKTIKTYVDTLKFFCKWLDAYDRDLENFTRTDVQQYITYLSAKGKKPSYIHKNFNSIKSFCKWSKKPENIESIRIVKAPNLTGEAPKWLERKELLSLFRNVESSGNKRDIAIIFMLYGTGARVEELVKLNRNSVNMTERTGSVTIQGKGNKERTVPITSETKNPLKAYLETRIDDDEALFISNRGQRISVRAIQDFLKKKYGIHPHILRHTYIHQLVSSGVPINEVKKLSGHESTDMVMRYSEPSQKDLAKSVEKTLFVFGYEEDK